MRNTYLDALAASAEILHDIKVEYYLTRESGVGDKVEFVGRKDEKKYYAYLVFTDEYRATVSEASIANDIKQLFVKVIMNLVQS